MLSVRTFRALSLALGLLMPVVALSTVPDKYGVGARNMGMGGKGVALIGDGGAAFLNPAGLARIRRPIASVGVTAAIEQFEEIGPLWWDTNRDGVVDENDAPLDYSASVDDAVGFNLSMGRHVGKKFGFGIYAYVPLQRLFRLKTIEPDLPNYIMYDNRPQRYVFAAGVGGEVAPGFLVGASVDFVPKVAVTVGTTIGIGASAGDDDTEEVEELLTDIVVDVTEIQLDVVPGFAPVFGVQLDFGRWHPALQGLLVGATYRHRVGLPITVDIDLQMDISAEDLGELEPFIFAALIEADLFLFDHYVPSAVTFGAAYSRYDTFSVYADARWTDWKGMQLNVGRLDTASIQAPLIDIDPSLFRDGNAYDIVLKSAWSFHTGVDLHLPRCEFVSALRYLRLSIRGGFGYNQSPLQSQGSNSAFLDTDRVLVSGGLGAEVWDPFKLVDGPLRLDVFYQYNALLRGVLPRQSDVPKAGYPVDGSEIRIGGSVMTFGVEFGFMY